MNNKNLAKKGTIIALALAVVIGMSYFSSQDYLNMSIMDMLMGATDSGCKKWQDGCGSYLCPEGSACSIYDPSRSPKCHNYTCSVNKPDCDANGKPAGACKCGNLCTHADGTCRYTGFYHSPQGEHTHTCYDSHTYP